jgi:hypothetical protein
MLVGENRTDPFTSEVESEQNVSNSEEVENICDFSMLYEFTNSNKNIVESTLKLLLTIIPKDIEELSKEISLRNFSRVKAIAHRSKPNFKLICTKEYAGVIELIEGLSENPNNYNQIAKIISDLVQKENYILSSIEQELSSL